MSIQIDGHKKLLIPLNLQEGFFYSDRKNLNLINGFNCF